MRILILSLALLKLTAIQAQPDSIELNYLYGMYDFKISDNQYCFSYYDNQQIIEQDSIIFDVDKFFNNFKDDKHIPKYLDSMQFAIASRTLKKFYKEPILFNEDKSFIRICMLSQINQTIIKIIGLSDERLSVNIKIAEGDFDRHGIIVFDSTFLLLKFKSNRIKKLLYKNDYINMSHKSVCSGIGSDVLNLFYFEIADKSKYNIYAVNFCNLTKKQGKDANKLFRYIKKACGVNLVHHKECN